MQRFTAINPIPRNLTIASSFLSRVICFLSPTTSDFELHEVHMEKGKKKKKESHSRVVLKRVNKRRRMEKKVYYKADGGGCVNCAGELQRKVLFWFSSCSIFLVLCLRDEKKEGCKNHFFAFKQSCTG